MCIFKSPKPPPAPQETKLSAAERAALKRNSNEELGDVRARRETQTLLDR